MLVPSRTLSCYQKTCGIFVQAFQGNLIFKTNLKRVLYALRDLLKVLFDGNNPFFGQHKNHYLR